jgi:hypothetical protein
LTMNTASSGGSASAAPASRASNYRMTGLSAPPALQIVLGKIQPHVLGSTPSARNRVPTNGAGP